MTTTPTVTKHGLRGYSLGCRCYTCGWAHSQWDEAREKSKAHGTWQPYVPVEPVREHLRNLSEAGVGRRRVAELSGVNQRNIQRICRGTRITKLRPETARRLLAVPVDPAPEALVDSAGSRRRIESLVAAGWSMRVQATAVGWFAPNYQRLRTSPTIRYATAQMIARLYDDLSMKTPTPGRSSTRAIGHARRQGWFPPLAWDDDTIDDPAALPCLMPAVDGSDPAADELQIQHWAAGHACELSRVEEVEIVRRLIADGTPFSDISKRLHRSPTWVNYVRKEIETSAATEMALEDNR